MIDENQELSRKEPDFYQHKLVQYFEKSDIRRRALLNEEVAVDEVF